MDAWQGIGAAVVATFVSIAVTLGIRFWDSRKVAWLITGEAHDEYESGRPTGRLRATMEFHNIGDGDAFGVTTRRRNGDEYESFEMFESGKVAAGESVEVVMRVDPQHWKEAWVELHWATSPIGRSKTSQEGPHHLWEVLWRGEAFDQVTRERQRRMLRRPRKQT